MIGLDIQNRGAFNLAIHAAELDQNLRNLIKQIAREYQAIAASALSSQSAGRLYGARTFGQPGGRQRYRTVRKRVELFGGRKGTVTRRVALKQRQTVVYRGSAPGQPPGKFSGNLLRSLRMRFPAREKGYGAKVFAHRGTGAHRQLLEFGTGRYRTVRGPKSKGDRAKTHMQPRPLWSPLQKRALDDLHRRLLAVIDASAAFRGGGA